ncbi:MAG: hypothetical protein BMS9Abin25_0039 [Gammaproteobacteria bacterium]|nr:MAG: hypothetical protein BMS9Abin25_0039 [Gammaproteobacteria bacterium]
MKLSNSKLNSNKPGIRTQIRSVVVLLGTLSLLGTGVASAGGFTQVKPFEYSTSNSESLTSLYGQWEPLESQQKSISETLSSNPFVPSLIPHLSANSQTSLKLRTFSMLDPNGYYRVSSLEDGIPSDEKETATSFLGVVVLVGYLAFEAAITMRSNK